MTYLIDMMLCWIVFTRFLVYATFYEDVEVRW